MFHMREYHYATGINCVLSVTPFFFNCTHKYNYPSKDCINICVLVCVITFQLEGSLYIP